jgi:hypothetical protein
MSATFITLLCWVGIMLGGVLIMLGSRRRGGQLILLSCLLAVIWPFAEASAARLLADICSMSGWLKVAAVCCLLAAAIFLWDTRKGRGAGSSGRKASEPPTSLKRRIDPGE